MEKGGLQPNTSSSITKSSQGGRVELMYAPSPAEPPSYALTISNTVDNFLLEMAAKVSTDAALLKAKSLGILAGSSLLLMFGRRAIVN